MSDTKSNGLGVGSLLLVAFVVLKLCHQIDWPWLWVLAPMWAPLALFAAVFVAIFIGGLFIAAIGALWNR